MTIFLGGNRVGSTNFGHLQVIYLGRELEVQSGLTWQFKSRTVDGQTNGQPHTPGYGDPENYAQTALNLGDRSSADVWHLLVNAHHQFARQFAGSIPYLGLTQNSNSYVTTLLSIVGVDVGGYLGLIDLPGILVETDPMSGIEPYIEPFNGYPGSGMNVLDRFSPNFTLNGRGSDDIIRTGAGDDRLSGNGGHDRIDAGAGQDTLYGGGGNDTLEGAEGQDQLFGGHGNDLLYGGDDADMIFGGAGNDTIWFDEDDVINAGPGRDTAYLSSLPLSVSGQAISVAAIDIDLHATAVEILVLPAAFTSGGGHRITGIGANDMVAAGGGDDTLVIDRTAGGAPAIVWGGAGADTFEFVMPEDRVRPLGLMVVNVANLTESNFAQFHRGLINGTSDLRWNHIDAIILNPDANDRVLAAGGDPLGTSMHTAELTQFYAAREGDEVVWRSNHVTSYSYLSGSPDPEIGGGMAGNYSVNFLGGGTRTVFAAAATPNVVSFMKWADPDVDAALGPHWWEGVLSTGSALRGADSVGMDWLMEEHYFTHIGYALAYPNGYGRDPSGRVVRGDGYAVPLGVASIEDVGVFTRSDALGPWFVLGGRFEGTDLIADGTYSATLPAESMFL